MVWVLRFAVLYCTAIGCGLCYDVLCCAVPCFICDMVLCSEVCLDVTWRMMYCAMYIMYTGDMWCSIVRCVDMWYVTRCLCVLCYDFLIRDMMCCSMLWCAMLGMLICDMLWCFRLCCAGDMLRSLVRCVDMWYVTRCLCVLCYDFLIRDMMCCDVPCFACDGVLCGEVRWYVTKWRVKYYGGWYM